MEKDKEIAQRIALQRLCVLVPTYNNAKTLARVLDGILHYTSNVLVVNDGATDDTATILSQYPTLTVMTFAKNRGKGKALQQGFAKARELGYSYVLTIDSDGQHYPEDIPIFLETLEASQEPTLWVGNRDMTTTGVPTKSSFGNKFSNFWFRLETGINLPDTQSGYRLYPLEKVPQRYFSSKFEWEIEVLVRTAWRGVAVKNVPIRVLYDPKERVSHFRPLRDFLRISVLNTFLVLIAFFYIKPRDTWRRLTKKSFTQFLKEDLLESQASDSNKALSVGLGVFFGIAPFWGLQTVLTLSLAFLFKLNKPLAFLASNVSIPPMIPVLVITSLKIGALFTGGTILPAKGEITEDFLKENLTQYLIGSFLLAIIASLLLSAIVYGFLKVKKRGKHNVAQE